MALSFVVIEEDEPWAKAIREANAREELLKTTNILLEESTSTVLYPLFDIISIKYFLLSHLF